MFLKLTSTVYLVILLALFLPTDQILAQEYFCSTGIKYNVWSGIKTNKDVMTVQRFLVKEKYLTTTPTGNFFDLTKTAVYNWQVNNGLNPTGVVGSLTRQAMNYKICRNVGESSVEYHLSPSVPVGILASSTKTVILNVPLFEQSYPLSCEVASLQMALAYKGLAVSQEILAEEIGISAPFGQSVVDGKLVWGDPDEAFVGDIKGYMRKLNGDFIGATGWGVNNGPVGKLAAVYRPGSVAKKQADVEDIKKALDQNKPVIFWHVRGGQPGVDFKYSTLAGKSVTMVQDHVALIVGYVEKPGLTIYVINDPQFGRIYLPEAVFLTWWGAYNNDMVIVS